MDAKYVPFNPIFTKFTDRLNSFGDWPDNHTLTPYQLASVGFYRIPNEDRVQCFCCGIGLMHWKDTDDPWEQHIRYQPNCKFINMVQSQEFIDKVVEKFKGKKEKCSEKSKAATASSSTEPNQKFDQFVDVLKCCHSETSKDPPTRPITSTSTQTDKGDLPLDELCKSCYISKFNTIFEPCGHSTLCAYCAMQVTECPSCNQPFTNVVKTNK